MANCLGCLFNYMHVSSRLHQTGLGLGAMPMEASKQNHVHGVRIEVRALNLADI